MDDATDDPTDDALDEDEGARNFGALPGQRLFDDIGLAGWDERSVWGYDAGVGSFYAQLWRNPGDGDAPDVWFSGVDPRYAWPGCLVLAVVEATGCDPLSVVRALGLANPRAALRTHSDEGRSPTSCRLPALGRCGALLCSACDRGRGFAFSRSGSVAVPAVTATRHPGHLHRGVRHRRAESRRAATR